MSEKLGAVGYSVSNEYPFRGRDIAEPREFGDDTARLLDKKVRSTLAAEGVARELLQTHQQQLEELISALLQRETLGHADIEELFGESSALQLDEEDKT